MIDIHSHILPCIDDGAKNIEESLKLCSDAIDNDVRSIIATPHIEGIKQDNISLIKKTYSEFRAVLKEKNIDINIHLGAEISTNSDIWKLLENNELLTMNNSRYVLLELSYIKLPVFLDELIFKLQIKKYKPILAHPERIIPFIKSPEKYFKLVENGALGQVNCGSITGVFGKEVYKAAESFLENDSVTALASDAHALVNRNFCNKQAYQKIKQLYGEDVSRKLFIENPEKILNDKDVSTVHVQKKKQKIWRYIFPFLR